MQYIQFAFHKLKRRAGLKKSLQTLNKINLAKVVYNGSYSSTAILIFPQRFGIELAKCGWWLVDSGVLKALFMSNTSSKSNVGCIFTKLQSHGLPGIMWLQKHQVSLKTRLGLQCRTPFRFYFLSLFPYPLSFILYPLSLIPYPLSLIPTPCSLSPSDVPFQKFR